ncbi:hypothetical protein FV139_04050 [Parahaliea maris]|uniref:Glycosyltransferase RgtA/B/C/D-like domain-containing protein n=1 Tax=Parahaliea maris TaxID=2716870 RepID=A0A5C9A6T2_9GAMM|nr:hypothetical protein [Parahaliea maris]TXS96655.1 hypothetical protein FV139_04050 [Parahaliea maris]
MSLGVNWLRAWFYGLVITAMFAFYAMNSGITITNDGSHFALFDAVVSNGSPELVQVRQFAFGDSALYEGRYYSDRNPGLALLTAAAYKVTGGLEPVLAPIRLDPKFARNYSYGQRKSIPFVMLVPALFAGLLLLVMYGLSRELGASELSAMLASPSVLFGTILLRYSTLFYSHIVAAALLSLSVLLFFRFRKRGGWVCLGNACFLFSLAVLVEHLMVLAGLPLAIYLLFCARERLLRPLSLLVAAAAAMIPMAVLMVYNWVCFDSPFSIAHFHHSTDAANHQLSTLLRVSHSFDAAINLFFGAPKAEVGRQDLVGLFSHSPFLLLCLALAPLAVPGWRYKAEGVVLLAAFLLLVAGGASVFAPYGGWDRDYRYFVAGVPLLAPLVALVLDFLGRLHRGRAAALARVAVVGLILVLFLYSVRLQFEHLRHPGQIPYDSLWVNLGASFQNVGVALALVLLLMGVIYFAYSKFSGRSDR